MGCLIGCFALAFPRLALGLVWLLGGNYVRSAFDGQLLWPVVGFFVLPLTTLTFAYASHAHSSSAHLTPFGWLLVALAVLFDIGILGGGGEASRRQRRAQRRRDD